MNIGVVTDFYYPWIGGPSTVVRNISQGLSMRGHTVSILAPSPSGKSYHERDASIEITRAPTLPSPFGFDLRVALFARPTVERWLSSVQPDVVHLHHPFPLSATAFFSARRSGIPRLTTHHTIPECSLWGISTVPVLFPVARAGFNRWLLTILRGSDNNAAPTETAAGMLRSIGFEGDIVPISNGVDTARFQPGPSDNDLRRRLRLDERPVILYTGRLDAEKQMGVWLRAAARAVRDVDAQLVIGGKGADRPGVEALARELGLDDRTYFIGYLDEHEFPAIYRLADVYAMTSPVELQSIATLEAISSGLPVVAVQAGALPELVHHGENGYLASPGDVESLASHLVHVLQNRNLRREMGARSRVISLQHGLDRSVDAYERLLTETAFSRERKHQSERPATVWR